MEEVDAQLREVFESCDEAGDGRLGEAGLRSLCEKLHLPHHANLLITHLLAQNSEVNFEDFKECFVAILSQEIPSDVSSKLSGSEDRADREVSPKFILGRKKYGRRSRPASIVDDENACDASSSPVVTTSCENFAGKRPMSPDDRQQPPTKSGRMREDSEPSFESSPVEYLRETWKKLGVGQDGFLNVEELAHVCEHIGMDMTEEVVVQLFQKLDCDQDGQISFNEFLQGLFEHGDPDPAPMTVDDRHNAWPSGIFSSIDPNHSGCVDASSLLELWESLELRCPTRLMLEELGYSTNSKINLSDLTTTFEDILGSALKRPVLQLAFATFQNELQHLRQSVEAMREERRKLRIQVEEANARADLLAQEVDDRHARLENALQHKLTLLEKKHQEQAREWAEELRQERELLHSQGAQLQQWRQEAARQEEADRLRLQQENSRLEVELRETTEKCLVAEKLNEALQKELVALPALKKKLSELESHLLQEQQRPDLVAELESCKRSNQELQDKIDELTLEMENIQQRNVGPAARGGVARNHSWLSDYKNTFIGYKRRGSESSSEENSDEDGIIINGMRETVSNDRQLDAMHGSAGANRTSAAVSADVLLKDMFLDQSLLVQKLQAAEERCLRTESAHRRAQLKIRALTHILTSTSRDR